MAKAQTGKHGGSSHEGPDTGEDMPADEEISPNEPVLRGDSLEKSARMKRHALAKKPIARVKHAPGAKRTPTGYLRSRGRGRSPRFNARVTRGRPEHRGSGHDRKNRDCRQSQRH